MNSEPMTSNYKDPNHPGNAIRPNIRCINCGKLGCITAWGPWCFECNVARFERIDASLKEIEESGR